MIALIQRVCCASVAIDQQIAGKIDAGLLVFLAVGQGDCADRAHRLCDRVLGYRIFADENNKMNRSVVQAQRELLVVSQFTLAADTDKGMRPGFSRGAALAEAERLYDYFVACCRQRGVNTQTGRFGANMQVTLVNDGPVTFWLQV